MKKFITAIDFTAASLVLISLFFITTHSWLWIVYAAACCVYVVLNFYKGLYGQSIMNIVAAGIAIINFFK